MRHTSGQEYTAPYLNNEITHPNLLRLYTRWTDTVNTTIIFESKAAALTMKNRLNLSMTQKHDIGIISLKTGEEI